MEYVKFKEKQKILRLSKQNFYTLTNIHILTILGWIAKLYNNTLK